VRQELDPIVTRASVVFNPIKVIITNVSEVVELEISNNPRDESAGKHKIHFGREVYIDGDDFSKNPPQGYKRLTVGGCVRLRGVGVIKCVKAHKDYLECEHVADQKCGVIHFVESTTAIKATVHEHFPLLKQGIELSEENLNPTTLATHSVLCENFLASAQPGDKFQFVRKGFFVCDLTSTRDNIIFNKTVSLKEGF
jgi:glutaminyl-tRNA synthetase